DVRPEPADTGDGMGEVQLAVFLEPSLPVPRDDGLGERAGFGGAQGRPIQPHELAALADHRRGVGIDVEVRGVAGGDPLEPVDELDDDRARAGCVAHRGTSAVSWSVAPFPFPAGTSAGWVGSDAAMRWSSATRASIWRLCS